MVVTQLFLNGWLFATQLFNMEQMCTLICLITLFNLDS